MSQKKKDKKKKSKKDKLKKLAQAAADGAASDAAGRVSRDPAADQELAKKLEKQGLLGSWVTFVMCGDESKEKCASAKQMRATWKTLKKGIKERKKDEKKAAAVRTRCFGVCARGPLVGVQPDGCWYGQCDPDEVEAILSHHLDGGQRPNVPRADP